MTNIKLIATDMDGTLLNKKRQISARTIEAIREAQAQGIIVAACTGRDFFEAEAPIREANLTMPIIGVNGADVRLEDGTMVERKIIAPELFKKIRDVLEAHDVYYEVYTSKGAFTKDVERGIDIIVDVLMSIEEVPSEEYARAYAKERFHQGGVKLVDNYETLIETDPLLKLLAFSKDDGARLAVREKLSQYDLELSASAKDNIEITHKSASKGIGLTTLAHYVGVDMEETMAIGDNENDISMLRAAKVGVAMANADASIQAHANWVTKTNHEDGVAFAIEQVLAGNALNV
ncbi:HAD family phosphatase [Paenalkalicoccus suaedae]|uniref:HAD family phosphatase n=1 Tax=Paenalkalicoccus suaedae TaxID=2592382 RepID=A0A859FEK2_9BACI|nr:Cof-type HAD-IIB family hydrolase [Paenalkalicoccus suaedae]QKS71014.1 HAD family phosphatase [Paenalkalicoccus suaedae]